MDTVIAATRNDHPARPSYFCRLPAWRTCSCAPEGGPWAAPVSYGREGASHARRCGLQRCSPEKEKNLVSDRFQQGWNTPTLVAVSAGNRGPAAAAAAGHTPPRRAVRRYGHGENRHSLFRVHAQVYPRAPQRSPHTRHGDVLHCTGEIVQRAIFVQTHTHTHTRAREQTRKSNSVERGACHFAPRAGRRRRQRPLRRRRELASSRLSGVLSRPAVSRTGRSVTRLMQSTRFNI